MTPYDIVKVLTAVAPIAASVASIATNNSEKIERKDPPNVTNISISITNNFYTNSQKESIEIANQMQNKLISDMASNTRYML